MDYIHKLPFLMGSTMSIIIGALNYKVGANIQAVYVRMAISLLLFFALGIYIRKTILDFKQAIEKKKAELEEMEKNRAHGAREQAGVTMENGAAGDDNPSSIEYTVGEGEDFTPLKISEVLSSTLKE